MISDFDIVIFFCTLENLYRFGYFAIICCWNAIICIMLISPFYNFCGRGFDLLKYF